MGSVGEDRKIDWQFGIDAIGLVSLASFRYYSY